MLVDLMGLVLTKKGIILLHRPTSVEVSSLSFKHDMRFDDGHDLADGAIRLNDAWHG